MEKLVSKKQCYKILMKLDPDCTFHSHNVKRLKEETMGGLIGHHFKLYIKYEQNNNMNTLQLFVKTLNKTSHMMYRISKNLCMFEKERLFFMKLLPHFQQRGIDVSFVPRVYLCEDETFIMEDLSLSDFRLFPKTKPLDLDHCYSCLATLAKFHVSSMLYEICKTKSSGAPYNLLDEYPDLLKDLVFSGGDGNDGAMHVETAVKGILAIAKLAFDDHEDLDDFEDKLYKALSVEDRNSTQKCSLLHGDLWSNNFLHRYEDDKLVETKLIDFQILKYGPPGLDVLQFLYSNTRKKMRDEHLDNFLEYYHRTLEELLHDRSLNIQDILPKKEFFISCESLKVLAKLQSIIDRCTTCLPDRNYFDVMNKEENLKQYMFVDRGQFLIEPYQTIPEYKDIIDEDLKELKEMLSGSG